MPLIFSPENVPNGEIMIAIKVYSNHILGQKYGNSLNLQNERGKVFLGFCTICAARNFPERERKNHSTGWLTIVKGEEWENGKLWG